MRILPRAFALLLLLTVLPLPGQTPATPAAGSSLPDSLDGKWLGEIHRATDSAEIGFAFEHQPDGRVLARLWCPNLNSYGAAVGWLTSADGKFSIPDLQSTLVLEHGVLAGNLILPDLGFTARRTGQLPVEPAPSDVPTGPAPAWTYRANGAFWTSPVTEEDTVYLGDSSGTFNAINVADGRPRWTFAAGTPLYGNAAVTPDAVYFAGDNGRLFKLDRATGRELWRTDIGGGEIPRSLPSPTGTEWDPYAAAPAVGHGMVIVGSADGTLRAFDAATAQPLWQFKAAGKIRAAALVTDDRVYVGSFDHSVYALDRRTGHLAWRFDTGSAVTTPPVLAAGRIVIGTRDKALLFALDARDGRPVWNVFYWFSWVESAPILADGRLYIGSSDSRRIRALDPTDGKVAWVAQVWGWTWGTPLVVGNTIYYATAGTPKYFITQRASLGALDRRTGALKWRKPLPLLATGYVSGIPGSLAFARGNILAASIDGTLTAYPAE